MQTNSNFRWKFHRIGGLDQVNLRTADELRHLGELDPKLWIALSCPSSGLEFDARTLELIDTDKDGRIRIPEVVAAVEWICSVLKDPAMIVDSGETFPLACINTDTEQGARLLATARKIAENLGKSTLDELSQEDMAKAVAGAAEQSFNGDGILPALPEFDEDIRSFIEDALAVMGGVQDAGGKPGINREIADAFMQSLREWHDWKRSLADLSAGLGGNAANTWELMRELHEKIDDYFLRCDLASYSPDALATLNADERIIASSEHGGLESVSLEELPLARIAAERPLKLSSGLNPAWRERVERFFPLINSRLSRSDSLTRTEWLALCEDFRPFDALLAAKPKPVTAEVAIAPVSSIEQLSEERIGHLLSGTEAERFAELAERDLSVPVGTEDIAAVERLVLYHRHLYRLLMNFTSFYDFYSLRKDAAFLAGTLYMDGRSCRLCLPVDDVARHSALASYSEICLLYCECRRKKKLEGGGTEEEKMYVVGAMTAGDADLLLEGRNGVFVDNTGQDWDATLVKVVSNPISLRQALWQPYKKLGRMVSEQIGKFAGEKQDQLTQSMSKKVGEVSTAATSGTPPAQGQSFDIGRSVGIFAAIGLALGAIGTALASIANALFSLAWWQFPLVFLGLFLLISGPSYVLAWLKLRRRTLGPMLEASGWAVNGQVPINLGLGAALTSTAVLPPNASRSYKDPFKRTSRWPWVVLLMAVLVGAGITWLWFNPVYWNGIFANTPLARNVGSSKQALDAGAAVKDVLDRVGEKTGGAKEENTTAPQTGNATDAKTGTAAGGTNP